MWKIYKDKLNRWAQSNLPGNCHLKKIAFFTGTLNPNYLQKILKFKLKNQLIQKFANNLKKKH